MSAAPQIHFLSFPSEGHLGAVTLHWTYSVPVGGSTHPENGAFLGGPQNTLWQLWVEQDHRWHCLLIATTHLTSQAADGSRRKSRAEPAGRTPESQPFLWLSKWEGRANFQVYCFKLIFKIAHIHTDIHTTWFPPHSPSHFLSNPNVLPATLHLLEKEHVYGLCVI